MNCQPLVSETALDGIKEWPIRYELDSPKSLDEVISAIRLLKNNKSPGEDSIPAEVLKCGIHILGPLLHNIFLNIWEKEITTHRLQKHFDCQNIQEGRQIRLWQLPGHLPTIHSGKSLHHYSATTSSSNCRGNSSRNSRQFLTKSWHHQYDFCSPPTAGEVQRTLCSSTPNLLRSSESF